MKLTMLGTGKAVVTECYNTCFVLSDGKKHFLVDGGGGSGISAAEQAGTYGLFSPEFAANEGFLSDIWGSS